jgi:hypothetical protein
VIEGSVELHQMRYYPRMGDIEVAAFDLYREETERGPVSAPLIDWSWYTGWTRVKGGASKGNPRVPSPSADINDNPGKRPSLFPHVAFPHTIVLAALGVVFFVLGLAGRLGPV